MAKKDKYKESKAPDKKSKKPILWIAGAILVAVVLLLVSRNVLFSGSGDKQDRSFSVQDNETRPVLNPSSDSGDKKGKSFHLHGKETKPVLDPSMFSGAAQAAYAAAKNYPEVMNQVYCYCSCDNPPINHKNLLSCFTDRHGAG
jgi:flagellar basal body-associated protein FliL